MPREITGKRTGSQGKGLSKCQCCKVSHLFISSQKLDVFCCYSNKTGFKTGIKTGFSKVFIPLKCSQAL